MITVSEIIKKFSLKCNFDKYFERVISFLLLP